MPVLVPQRSETSECVLLTLWAWGMEVAMLVELQAHASPEADAVALILGQLEHSPLRIEGGHKWGVIQARVI